MEHAGIDISSVDLSNQTITVTYANGAKESLANNQESHHKMYKVWLKPNPVFISDKFKVEMKNISLSCVNGNEKCCCDTKSFFSPPNEEKVKQFFTYMRQRDTVLPDQRSKWTKKV